MQCSSMASTTITLSGPAYKRLKKFKTEGDSFSDVILRELPEPTATCGELLESLSEFKNKPILDAGLVEKMRMRKKAPRP